MDRLRPDDPDTIGPYRLIARLGSGGMGVVFLGTKDTERVAIKAVRHSFLDDPSLRIRFEREIDTLRKVSSPHVATMVDSSTEGDFAWHAVEFVNGPTLRERVDSKGPLPEDQWWTLARQLAEALASVHELGIVHRDIKPANIIMSETGPKLIDFGISQDSDATSLTMTGLVAGSPAWLSPEQLEGTPVTAGSDLYSLGSVLVFAATGKSPWGDETSMSVPVVYQKILSGQTSLEGLTAKQKELITSLHDPSPLNRNFPGTMMVSAPTVTPIAQTKTEVNPPNEQAPGSDVPPSLPPSDVKPQGTSAQPDSLVMAPTGTQKAVFASLVGVVAAGLITMAVLSSGQTGTPGPPIYEATNTGDTSAEPYVELLSATVSNIDGTPVAIQSIFVLGGHGKLLVLDGFPEYHLHTIDRETMAPLWTDQLGWVSSVAPMGDYVAFSHQSDDSASHSLVLFDFDGGRVLDVINDVCEMYCYSAFSPYSDYFYFVQEADIGSYSSTADVTEALNILRVIDLNTGVEQEPLLEARTIGDIFAYDNMLAASVREIPMGQALEDSVVFIDLAQGDAVARVSTDDLDIGLRSIARDFKIDKENSRLYFLIQSELWAVHLDTFQVLFTETFERVDSFSVSYDGNYVAIAQWNRDTILIFDTEQRRTAQRLTLPSPLAVAYSVDGLLNVGGLDTVTVYEPTY